MKKKRKKRGTKKEKIINISAIIIVVVFIAMLLFSKTADNKEEENVNPAPPAAGTGSSNTNTNHQVKYSPLTPEEIAKVTNAILSSEFIKSIPEKEPISLTFFKFENGERIWQDRFLIGNNQLLNQGSPGISLTLHSKYISQFSGDNLCDIIKQANANRDLGFESKYSSFTLLTKYSGMLKYRDCFGI